MSVLRTERDDDFEKATKLILTKQKKRDALRTREMELVDLIGEAGGLPSLQIGEQP